MAKVLIRAKDVNRPAGFIDLSGARKKRKQSAAPPSNLPKIRDIVQDTDATKHPIKSRPKA